MSAYQGMSREELEAQYFLRGTRPGYEENDLPRWLERSARFRDSVRCQLDIRYGQRPRNTLDLFVPEPGRQAGLILYIHGGYWQRGDKSVYSYVAEPLVKRGFSVAVMNYQMCPDVRMAEIAPQAREAVAWLWRHAAELGVNRDNFNVMGHSAGAHLAVEMLATDWQNVDSDLPEAPLNSGVAVSGIYDLEPILYCSENEGLRMDESEANAVSPIHHPPESHAALLLAHGAREPGDMHRQTRRMFDACRKGVDQLTCMTIPDADHFETVDVLADETSPLFAAAMTYLDRQVAI